MTDDTKRFQEKWIPLLRPKTRKNESRSDCHE